MADAIDEANPALDATFAAFFAASAFTASRPILAKSSSLCASSCALPRSLCACLNFLPLFLLEFLKLLACFCLLESCLLGAFPDAADATALAAPSSPNILAFMSSSADAFSFAVLFNITNILQITIFFCYVIKFIYFIN